MVLIFSLFFMLYVSVIPADSLYHIFILDFFVLAPKIDAGKQHYKTLPAYFHGLFSCCWPGKLVSLETFCPQTKSILFPVEYLDHGTCPAAEHKHGTLKKIQVHGTRHIRRKTIDVLPHIGVARLNENPA
jgi:hypothetical protein